MGASVEASPLLESGRSLSVHSNIVVRSLKEEDSALHEAMASLMAELEDVRDDLIAAVSSCKMDIANLELRCANMEDQRHPNQPCATGATGGRGGVGSRI